jgi:leucyl-tRNA synthetase
MIYARFVTRFFHKIGLIDNPEPFKKFLFNGKVTAHDGQMFSKSKGNGVDPLEIIDQGYGADALRTYLMFAAPLGLWVRWDEKGVPGTFRFLSRVWNLTQEHLDAKTYEADKSAESDKLQRALHLATKKVTQDIEDLKFNTAIAALMELVNEMYKLKTTMPLGNGYWQTALEILALLIAPFAPHTAEELWHQLGNEESVHLSKWPVWSEEVLKTETINIVVQVNGKVRANLKLPPDSSQEDVSQAALKDENVVKYVDGDIKKTIFVPGRLINFVV